MIRFQDAFPGFRVLRLLPTEIPDRRRSIRNAGIEFHVASLIEDAAHLSAGHGDDRRTDRVLRADRGHAPHRRPGQEQDPDESADKHEPARDLERPVLPENAGLPENEKDGGQKNDQDPPPEGILVQFQHEQEQKKQ